MAEEAKNAKNAKKSGKVDEEEVGRRVSGGSSESSPGPFTQVCQGQITP